MSRYRAKEDSKIELTLQKVEALCSELGIHISGTNMEVHLIETPENVYGMLNENNERTITIPRAFDDERLYIWKNE
jgi:hypothetical protein